jgi:hypothetical protein
LKGWSKQASCSSAGSVELSHERDARACMF